VTQRDEVRHGGGQVDHQDKHVDQEGEQHLRSMLYLFSAQLIRRINALFM
jgi:hypothetical protein